MKIYIWKSFVNEADSATKKGSAICRWIQYVEINTKTAGIGVLRERVQQGSY